MSCQKQFLIALLLLVLPMMVWAADPAPAKSWTDKIKITGDFRYRHELISDQTGTAARQVDVPQRDRHRMRIRLGIQALVNDDISVISRFATSTFTNGTGSPVSTNQDLGSGFGEKPFWVDRAYIDYHPWKQFSARAGKFAVPFDGTDLVWAADINLEGIAALPSISISKTELYAGLGGFWAAERVSSAGPDQGLFVGQIGGTPTFGNFNGLLAVSYIDYGNVKNGPLLYNATKGMGNSTHYSPLDSARTTLLYNNDYNMIDVTGQAQFKTDKIDYTVLGDFVKNTGSEKDTANTGWLAGFTLKFKKLPIDWDFAYNYRSLKSNATIGIYADPLIGGGGTNVDGHRVSAYFTVLPGTRVGVCYMQNRKDPGNAKLKYNSLLVDLEAKF
jgi:hypothetical protein